MSIRLLSQEYDPAIDGLRAVAIVAVLGFHFSPYRFPGGYVGVDVFFVISGFLITRIIIEQLRAGTFSFRRFYRRRFYRIVPALAVTVLATLLFGIVLFTPTDLTNLGASSTASLLMVPNVLFWSEAGYFDVGADRKPLLHFWSLGVEEQFYWIWPIVLLAAYRWRRISGVAWLIAATCVLSLLASEYVLDVDSMAAFYLMPFRMAEFAIGAACLWIPRFGRTSLAGTTSLAAGMLMIASATFVFDEYTRFPGVSSLLPCLGTALAIIASRTAAASLTLGNSVATGLGRISYSLYLVHWPLLVFAGYWKTGTLTRSEKTFLLAVSVISAWLLYRYVEQRFRLSGVRFRRRGQQPHTKTLTAVFIIGLVTGVYALHSGGIPQRIEDRWVTEPATAPAAGCELVRKISEFERICEIRADGATRRLALVIGDSHADHLVPALSYLSREAAMDFRVWTHWGCPPLWGVHKSRLDEPARERSCTDAVQRWESHVEENHYDLIVLAARWMWLFEPVRYGALELRRDYLVSNSDPVYDVEVSRRLFSERIASTVKSIVDSGAPVVVISQVPLLARSIIECDSVPGWLYSAEHRRQRCDPGVTYQEQIDRLNFTDSTIESLGSACVLPILPSEYLCDPAARACLSIVDGQALYSDTDHLSVRGSLWLATEIQPRLAAWLESAGKACTADRTSVP